MTDGITMAIVEDDIRMQLAGYLKTKVFVSRPLNRGAGLDRLLATGPAPNLIVFDGTLPRHDVLSICRPREAGGLAIVITSFAFILGAVPLAVATGASTYSQRAIGTGVLGGMVSAMQLDEINHRSCRATSQRSLKNHRATSGT